ncbi:right-handed parallel beta-helix repeat-containing protein [uncultured Nitrosomonas sp.]|uniref:right-handed parallel beta-helix repeat-containing protein n=1 Tax=uncultured Nitrosomonas sp. TaxID=156424 RepID=UPI0025D1EB0A|nr:right-handed parallel beta-helix repeat-containing protein [uncultured Nitrosomonas sp.]
MISTITCSSLEHLVKKCNLVFLVSLISASLIGTAGVHAKTIGPQAVIPTSVAKGTLFAKPNGSGTACSMTAPCDIWTVISKARGGDVVFLRAGTYVVSKNIRFANSGTAANPIVYESYPGEFAVFDGGQLPNGTDINIILNGNFTQLRNLEIRNMPMRGIVITGSDNLIDGMHTHHNGLSGIHIWSDLNDFPNVSDASRNIIRNSIAHDNSGVGDYSPIYANGGNSDGIAISSGNYNRIENCLVYDNSDDGIDTWRSTHSYVGYNIVYSNGIGSGNGTGIKAGGAYPSINTIVEHNLSYLNNGIGINSNFGTHVTFSNNTTWSNKVGGYKVGSDTILNENISSDTAKKFGSGIETDNSWQRSGSVAFISTDPVSTNFLVPGSNGGFDDIGAFVNVDNGGKVTSLPDIIVTQLSYTNGIFMSTVKNQGAAATPADVVIGVGYSINGKYKTWGAVRGPLVAGASVTIGTNGAPYTIPDGTHTMTAYVDDLNRFMESNETNNKLSKLVTVP